MSGRTFWFSKDASWWRREGIVALVEEFGPVGPAVIDWLECEAKLQNQGGDVKTGLRAIARGIGSDVVTVRDVLRRSVTERVIVDASDDDRVLKLHLLWWKADQDKGTHANRQSRYRDKQRDLPDVVTVRDGECRTSDGSDEDRTGQLIREAKASPVELGPIVAELFAYWQAATGHPQAKLTKDRRAKIEARLREGYTAEQIRKAIDGAARAAFVNDDGKRFDDIELICRSGSKLESFIDRANDDGRPPAGSVSRIGPRPQRPSAGDLIDEIRANVGAA